MKLSISPAGPQDYATLADLHGLCLEPAWNAESVTGLLEVAEDNVAARALYGSAGFTAVGRHPNYNRKIAAEPVAALVLRREITSS